MNEFQNKDRVRITRKVQGQDGRSRWVKVVEDGIVIDRRFGSRGQWVRVLAPVTLEGQLLNVSPDAAEWFPVESVYMRVIKINHIA